MALIAWYAEWEAVPAPINKYWACAGISGKGAGGDSEATSEADSETDSETDSEADSEANSETGGSDSFWDSFFTSSKTEKVVNIKTVSMYLKAQLVQYEKMYLVFNLSYVSFV